MAMLRVLLIVGALGALTAWVVATGIPVSDDPQGTSAAGAGDRPGAPEPAVEGGDDLRVTVDRLRAGLAGMPLPSSVGRNPFRFGIHPGEHGERRAADGAPDDARPADEGSTAPEPPPMRLLGIAEDAAEQGPVRTAVIATPRQLYLVREGEQIALRFLVTRVGADAVELQDLATDSAVRLTLR